MVWRKVLLRRAREKVTFTCTFVASRTSLLVKYENSFVDSKFHFSSNIEVL